MNHKPTIFRVICLVVAVVIGAVVYAKWSARPIQQAELAPQENPAVEAVQESTTATSSLVKPPPRPLASPNALFVGEPTVITITAQVAADPNLLPNSVKLVRLDDQEKAIAVLTEMYDDGTHGDVLSRDGTFTTQITLNEPAPGHLNFAVTTAYKGALLPVKSPASVIPVVRRPTNIEIQQVDQITDAGSTFFAWRRLWVGNEQARRDLVEYLNAQPGVADATVSIDGTTISILFTSGLSSGIFTSPSGTK